MLLVREVGRLWQWDDILSADLERVIQLFRKSSHFLTSIEEDRILNLRPDPVECFTAFFQSLQRVHF